jgi:hypothetical protein
VAPADPEPDDGADDEPNPPEPDDEDDPELDDEPELDEEPELELAPLPADDPLEPDDVAECPVLLLAADPVLPLVCAAAGSSTMTRPATATPTMPAPMVAVRSRRPARSRATTADTVRWSLCMGRAPLGGS